MNGRITDLSYMNQSTNLKNYNLQYDDANNIARKNESEYNYDRLNQLVFAGLKGKFENKPQKEEQLTFQEIDDYDGQQRLENEVEQLAVVELDCAAGSIGVDLEGTFPVTKLTLTPDNPLNRVAGKDIEIYESIDNLTYSRVSDWEYYKGEDGEVTIIFNEPIETRFIKIKSYFDERDEDFKPVNKAEFINTAEDLINVYYYVTDRLEEYDYDAGGNRVKAIISQRYTDTTNYSYYSDSNRLKSNGEYAYVYDDNGNLIEKGTDYTIAGNSVTIDPEGEEYWAYEYDLLDRLTSVRKNGATVANYTYNHKGLRIKKENLNTITYYAFGINDNVLYEQENGEYSEYIYVGGQHLARVDGDITTTELTTYFYHTDHLGSTVLVTNADGNIVWSSEYTPFGNITIEEGEFGFQKAKKFTGKDLDEDTGLYYYNARWYDAEVGRFTSEDTYKGELENPQSLNLYIYTSNNPLVYVDHSGHFKEEYNENYGYPTEGVVEEGDTLSDIALDIYNNEFAVETIANMNGIEDKDSIDIGQVISLPGVAYDGSGGAYMQPGFIDGAREVPDAFIAGTIVGTAGLEAGGLEAVAALGTSAYDKVDKVFEKGYYWASDKLGKFNNFLSNKVSKFFNKGSVSSGADNIATGSKLKNQLTFEEANSIFTKSGELKPEVIKNSNAIISGS